MNENLETCDFIIELEDGVITFVADKELSDVLLELATHKDEDNRVRVLFGPDDLCG